MTDYGKRKCELLEEKGFEANNLLYWVEHENDTVRVYGFVEKRIGAEVKRIFILLTEDIDEMQKLYAEIKTLMNEIADYNKAYNATMTDTIDSDNADYDWMFSAISEKADKIQMLNLTVHKVTEGEPWHEVAAFFESDGYNDSTGEYVWSYKG